MAHREHGRWVILRSLRAMGAASYDDLRAYWSYPGARGARRGLRSLAGFVGADRVTLRGVAPARFGPPLARLLLNEDAAVG